MQEIKLTGESKDIVSENVSKIKEIFPEVISEDKIDFEKLKLILGKDIETDNETYSFTWPGKTKAIDESQKQSTGTLRPCKEESKDWDTTENLYIEGDNLEVLKLLQKTYYGKIKAIYIDPPYNTGEDFIYPDNYQDNIQNYFEISNQYNTTNREADGRFHTKWLNMIYPRLRLAKNLLTDDGVIFISIDDNEVNNLKQICDEIFGEENFVNLVSAKVKNIAGASGGGEDKKLKKNLEYILIYVKNYNNFNSFNNVYEKVEIEDLLDYYESNNISWKYTSVLVDTGEKKYVCSTYDGEGDEIKIYKRINPTFSSINKIRKEENMSVADVYMKYFDYIFTTAMPQSSIRKRVLDKLTENHKLSSDDLYSIEYVPKSGKHKNEVYEQFYKGEKLRLFSWFKDVAEIYDGKVFKKNKLGTLWEGINLNNLSKEGDIVFKNGKKPLDLLDKILSMVKFEEDDIVLDFFSGSATTAHAVMKNNLDENSNIHFIMVQLPEKIPKKDAKLYPELSNICDIGKERIRRAGDKIVEETGASDLDIGFKVFKLDSSNLEKWDPDYENLEQTLLMSEETKKDGRSDEDLIYEIMLKYGVDLTLPIEEHKYGNNTLYSIGFGGLIFCLDNNITKYICEDILNLAKKAKTTRVVFKDTGFASDSDKTNIKETLKVNGIKEFITI